jgi:hypothetical protein
VLCFETFQTPYTTPFSCLFETLSCVGPFLAASLAAAADKLVKKNIAIMHVYRIIISQISVSEIGRRFTRRTSDPREASFLLQRISIAIHRFNAVCLANMFELAVGSFK